MGSDPRCREIGRVTSMDGEDLVIGVDHDAVAIYIGAWLSADGVNLESAAAEEFAQLYVSACWQAARQAGEMAAEAVSDDGPVFITVNDAPPHPPRTLADYEQAGGVDGD